MDIDKIVKEIRSVKTLLDARGPVADDGGLSDSYAASFIQQLSSTKELSIEDGTRILNELLDSPYGEAGTAKIKKWVDAKLGSHAVVSSKKLQFLQHWQNYMTQPDMDLLRDPKKSINAKMVCMVERGNLVGCRYYDEQTLKWMLAMLIVVHYDPRPHPKKIYQLLQDLKACTNSERKPFTLTTLLRFPSRATELPKEIYKHAYADNPPVDAGINGIASVADCIPLRKNSSLLSKDTDCNDIPGKRTKRDGDSRDAPIVKRERARSPSVDSDHADLAPRSDPIAVVGRGSAKIEIDAPQTPEEHLLLAQYNADLWKLRARATGVLSQPPPPVKLEVTASSPQLVDRVAGFKFSPRELEQELKIESPPTPKAFAKADIASEESDLDDPFAKAAIKALESKKKGKKSDKDNVKAEGKVKSEGKVKKESKIKKKRMGGANAKAEKVVKKEKASTVKSDPAEIAKKDILAAMPKSRTAPDPVHYRGGVIYTVPKKHKFRALRTRGDRYSEKSSTWSSSKPQKVAWKECVDAIDLARTSKR